MGSKKADAAYDTAISPKAAPTIKDVAKEAGVAIGTVSKVINGIPVGAKYRARVEAAIEKLHYQVDTYAQGLRSNRTCVIEVIIPNLINPFFAKLVNCINRELAQRNYKMLLCATDADPNLEQAYLFMAVQQRVDGIICLSYEPRLRVPENIPLISIDRYFGAKIPCIASDNYGGGRLAAEKLVENGCRNLAFLRIGSKLSNETNKRKDGFVSVCEELGIPYTLQIVDDGTPYSAFEVFLQEHMQGDKLEFDGIFCVTDALAHQIQTFLRNMGIRVPEDVQIIGYDGVRYFGDMELLCSTIVQPVEAIAKTCVDLVLDDSLESAPSLVCLPVNYAYGGTTKK